MKKNVTFDTEKCNDSVTTRRKPNKPETMATFKALVLSHQKRKDGTYNVKIRVTHNRRHKYLPTPLYAGKDDLTKSLKIKNYLILDATEAMIKDYRTKCSAMGTSVAQYDVDQLCAILNEPDKGEWKVNFFRVCRKVYSKKTKQERHS